MDLKKILNPEIQEFITINLKTEIAKLALKKNPFENIDYSQIINQIVSKEKARVKLPTWFQTKNIIFPPKISIEQTSSEITAQYKSTITSGNSLIDLSGGFGVDDYYFSKKIAQVYHCEINTELSKIVKHNCNALQTENITCINSNSTDFLQNSKETFDWIYVDPSRRNDIKGKVFMLKDCEPNIQELLPLYFSKSNNILIKTAPILDIQAGLSELQCVKKIHIVAINNEVKELLWELENNYQGSVNIKAINIEKGIKISHETILDELYNATYSNPKKYLYEPNSAVLKGGNFNSISQMYSCEKLHQHSHLFTSDNVIDFPGRKFIIQKELLFQKKELKENIIGQKMNISTRNFPIKVEEIKKKYKIKDGGLVYTFFTTNLQNQKIILICTKI